VELRPIYRAGQLFEAVPGLVVTIHSGEGKAQQYLIRGTTSTMAPISPALSMTCRSTGRPMPMAGLFRPQLPDASDRGRGRLHQGPYTPGIGDFGSVASAHTSLLNDLPARR
jgi:hypothetical protein